MPNAKPNGAQLRSLYFPSSGSRQPALLFHQLRRRRSLGLIGRPTQIFYASSARVPLLTQWAEIITQFDYTSESLCNHLILYLLNSEVGIFFKVLH